MGKVPDSAENAAACICGDCPSKPEDLMMLYCARGQSTAKVKTRGCVCPDCSLTADIDLDGDYYCETGVVE
jgi:hypothetical protein